MMEIASPMPRVPPVTTATLAISSSLLRFLFSPSFNARRYLPFNTHGDAHAAADAQRRQPLLGVTPAHLMKERHQHPRTRGADGMAECNGATIDVDLAGIPAQFLVHRTGLGGESLIGLDQIQILLLPAGRGQSG